MATLQAQVEGLTSLSVGTTPTTAELAEFLKDGVTDVTNRWLLVRPQDIEDFVRGSSTQSSNGFATYGADISSVIREAGADGDDDGSTAWKECRKVPSSMRSKVVDGASIYFASKYNPVYIINNNSAVNVYPTPDGTHDGYRVYYVNNEPKGDGLVDDLAAGHTTIGYFPKNKVYLVVMYAGIKSLQANLGAMGISTFSLSASAPVTPPDPSISYSAGSLTSDIAAAVDSIAGAVDGIVAGPSDASGTSDTEAPSDASGDASSAYVTPTITTGTALTVMDAVSGEETPLGTDADYDNWGQWFNVLGELIEDEEDSELAQAQIGKIQAFIQAFQAEVQDASTAMQATIQDAQLATQASIANASNDVSTNNASMQTLVQASIANASNDTQASISKMQQSTSAATAKMVQSTSAAIQKMSLATNVSLQNAAKTLEASIQDYSQEIALFQGELGKYQAQIGAEIQAYQQEIAEKGAEYQWMTARLKDLKEEYDRAFLMAAPKQQQANA